ncbi:MAG: hypothetical protein EXR29_08885 [Betaproteobacteria bacterium]|nr:hypothetical protein [Betaproteobacteria bacterium]
MNRFGLNSLAIALLILAFPVQAQRAQGAIECKPMGTDFVYACTIRLTQAGYPLTGVQVTLGADMPSMPMAHNVRPVQAAPGTEPGEYRAQLQLEMQGEWAVKVRLDGRVKDLLILHYHFDDKGAQQVKPAAKSGKAPR